MLEWVQAAFSMDVRKTKLALRALQLQFRLRRALGGAAKGPVDDLLYRMTQDSVFAMDVLDWMLHNSRYFKLGYHAQVWAGELGDLLHQGGSAWEVSTSEDAYQLTRRAVGPVVEVLEQTATEAARAHEHLASAWSRLMGRDPDPSGAYREAVRAVEAIAKPVVLPNNNLATLGQMISAMKEKPEKWAVTIGTVGDVRAQMEAVWKGQLDRHGTDDESVPLNVSTEEADAAFSTCLNLVRQFSGGHIAPVA